MIIKGIIGKFFNEIHYVQFKVFTSAFKFKTVKLEIKIPDDSSIRIGDEVEFKIVERYSTPSYGKDPVKLNDYAELVVKQPIINSWDDVLNLIEKINDEKYNSLYNTNESGDLKFLLTTYFNPPTLKD